MSRGVIKDLTGRRFGRLVVRHLTGERRNGCVVWHCLCDCGEHVDVKSGALASGNTKSCGCLKRDSARESHTKHGHSHTPISCVWIEMNQRCSNPSNHSYRRYGARGITVCNEWRDSFEAFYDYVSQLPHFGEKGYSLDRINNDGNYESGNVRWATAAEQVQNRRNSRTLTIDGDTRSIKEWAAELGITYFAAYNRARRGSISASGRMTT